MKHIGAAYRALFQLLKFKFRTIYKALKLKIMVYGAAGWRY